MNLNFRFCSLLTLTWALMSFHSPIVHADEEAMEQTQQTQHVPEYPHYPDYNGAKAKEENSPAANYQFSITDIQECTREGVKNADKVLMDLESKNLLGFFAEEYFADYLNNIHSYNMHKPQVNNMLEAYRTEVTIAYVLKAFKDRFPHLIFDQSDWFFNSVGGIYANTIILYCSLHEYIVIWGTSEKSYGNFSGYYPFMNEFDVLLTGEMTSHDADNPGHASVIYKPIMRNGIESNTVDTSNLFPANIRSYSLQNYSYMVSYAQGNMMKAFGPGAIMPGVFVNQDFGGLASHLKECALSYTRPKNILKKPLSVIGSVFKKAKKAKESVFPKKVPKLIKSKNNYRAIDMIEAYFNK